MTAQQIIDAAMAACDELPAEDRFTDRGKPIIHLDYTADGERILGDHIQRALDEVQVIADTRLLAFQQAEAQVAVLHEALTWILARAEACVTGTRAAICSIQDRAQDALDAVQGDTQ